LPLPPTRGHINSKSVKINPTREIEMIGVYNVYNNAATIRESLLSVLPYVKRVIAIDGAYIRFPHKLKSGASTDATKKIFHELCGSKLTWIDQKKPMSQVAKRNKLLRHTPNGEWFFILSGDEVVTGKIKEAFNFAESSKYRNIGVPIKNFHPIWKGYKVVKIPKYGLYATVVLNPPIPKRKWNKIKWKPYFGVGNRLVLKQKGLRFRGHHSTMFRGGKLMRTQVTVKDVLITNQPQKVGWKRWHQKIAYKQKRYKAGDFEG